MSVIPRASHATADTPLWVPAGSGGGGGVTGILSTEVLLNPVFSGTALYSGPGAFTFGSFTIPADAVPGSTVLAYVSGWTAEWSPPNPGNLLHYIMGLASDPDSTNWYSNPWGFVVEAGNTTNVPNPIPYGANATSSYVQLPGFVCIPNVQPGQLVYLNVNPLYLGDDITRIGVIIPYMVYQRQSP